MPTCGIEHRRRRIAPGSSSVLTPSGFASGQDLESIDALEEYIDRSQVIMIFVSKGYFLSTNCLREARTATEKAKPPKWTDPRPAVWARPQPAAPTPREPAGPSVAAAMERFRPMGQQAPRRSHQLVPADTRGKAWADPRPPPPRDLTQFAVPLAGF